VSQPWLQNKRESVKCWIVKEMQMRSQSRVESANFC
jgi:hypothetical protein